MYKEYYQLASNPFQISPNHDMFFPSHGHKKALSYLHSSLNQNNGIIVITGKLGLGKTTLIKKKSVNLDPKYYIVKQIPVINLDENNLFSIICEAFDLISKGLSQDVLLKQFHAFLNSINKLGRKVILIFDDAQKLTPILLQQLQILSTSKVNYQFLLIIYLVGQKKLLATLQNKNMKQIRQYILSSCALIALKKDELSEYINYRLKVSGWSGEELFDAHSLDIIYQLTNGEPRRVNLLCDRVLLFGYLEDIQFFTAEHIKCVAQELKNEMISPIKKEIKSKNKKTNKLPQVRNMSDSSDFVDIEESIREFDLSIEKEIQDYKNMLISKN